MESLINSISSVIATVVSITMSLAYPDDPILTNNYWILHCKNSSQQEVVDDINLGAHFYYGIYNNEVFCDHNNQVFKDLKNIKIGDKCHVYYYHHKHKDRILVCKAIEIMKVDDQGHIRDKDGLYMGDAYAPCVILYTCYGKDRLVTIWDEYLPSDEVLELRCK